MDPTSIFTVKNRLIIGFTILIGLILVVGSYSFIQEGVLGDQTVKMYKHPLAVTRAALRANVGIIKMHRSMKDVALAKDEAGITSAKARVAGYEKEVYDQYAIVEDRILGKEGEQLIAETIQVFRDWKPIRDEVITLMGTGKRSEAAAITKGRGARHVGLLSTKMDALVDNAAVKGEGFFNKALKTTSDTQMMMMLLVAAAVVTAIIAAFLLIRSIVGPIDLLRTTIQAIEAESDLTRRIELSSEDEIGRTASAFDAMLNKFQSSMNQVSHATSQLATTAEETSVITGQTTHAIEHQLSETTHLATAMTEMNATVREVASNVTDTAHAATDVNEQASAGLQAMQETISQIQQLAGNVESAAGVIHQLERQSEEIGSVIDVIKSIAEQTNLLALNAAIEAARAGEQGRGFAVVADEVRNLASKTQDSTEEINQMIDKLQNGSRQAVAAMGQSQEKAHSATEQASKTGDALSTIAEAIGRINEMSTHIAGATKEQSAVADEVNKNIDQINSMTEQTSAGAQQTMVASGDLTRLASDLQGLVAQFKVQ